MDFCATVAGSIDAYLVNTIPKWRYPPPARENNTKRLKEKLVEIPWLMLFCLNLT